MYISSNFFFASSPMQRAPADLLWYKFPSMLCFMSWSLSTYLYSSDVRGFAILLHFSSWARAFHHDHGCTLWFEVFPPSIYFCSEMSAEYDPRTKCSHTVLSFLVIHRMAWTSFPTKSFSRCAIMRRTFFSFCRFCNMFSSTFVPVILSVNSSGKNASIVWPYLQIVSCILSTNVITWMCSG